jgi:hypothetical protein
MEKKTTFYTHELDPEVGRYVSAHHGSGQSFIVFTSPISHEPEASHMIIVINKIQNHDRNNSNIANQEG